MAGANKKRRTIKFAVILTLVGLGAGGFVFLFQKGAEPPTIKTADEVVSGKLGVPETIKVPEGESSVTVTSEPMKSVFEFNAIAPHWKEKPGTEGYEEAREMQIRVSNDNKNWSEWIDVHVEGPLRDNDPHPDEVFPEAPIFVMGRYFQFKVDVARPAAGGDAAEMSNIVVSYLDSREKMITKVSQKVHDFISPRAVAEEQGPNVITRREWGTPDPDHTLFKGTDKDWTLEYRPVTQIFIHHTVNSNYSGDFAEVVRGIWQYQSYTRAWGDIGYNYLVDGNGKIYEGRYGGDNVVAGHVTGFNRGSMGVALIGCFQPNNSSCVNLNGGNAGPSASMLDSLYNLIGWKAKNYEIDPRAAHEFCGTPNGSNECRTFYTVTGHRDGQLTACPGNYVYDLLPTIRDAAESRRANLFPYAAKQLTYGPIVSNSSQSSITLQFKNTGSATWSRTSPRFFLKTANPNDRTSTIQGDDWTTSQHAALLNEASVPPGGTGTFTFNVNTDDKPVQTFYEGFRLVAEGETDLKSYFMVPIATPTYSWSLVSQAYSSGSARMAPGSSQTITIVARNNGTATWTKNGSYPFRLGAWPDGRASSFYHSSWTAPIRMANLQEDTVAPNGEGTFIFQVHAPQQEGEYGERFNLVAENRTWSTDIGAQLYFHVVNPYRWQIDSINHSSGTAVMNPGETQNITIRAKNIGSATWSNTGDSPVKLGTWGPGRNSAVMHSSWPSTIRAAVMQEATVAPNDTGTFIFAVRAPYGGEFFERMNLVAEGQTWFNDPGLSFYLRVRQNYAWEPVWLNHSTGTAINQAGSTLTLTLKARNVGDVPWHNDGEFPVRLGTTRPQDRGSILYHSSWVRDFRPVVMQETTVQPGDIGTFVFTARVPTSPGEYREHFSLVAENITWFNDPGVFFYLKSVP